MIVKLLAKILLPIITEAIEQRKQKRLIKKNQENERRKINY